MSYAYPVVITFILYFVVIFFRLLHLVGQERAKGDGASDFRVVWRQILYLEEYRQGLFVLLQFQVALPDV